jgi:hypothetical protein
MIVDRANRMLLALVGLLAVALGVVIAAWRTGRLGDERDAIIDADLASWIERNDTTLWVITLVSAFALLVLGAWWLRAQVAPLRRREQLLVMRDDPRSRIEIDLDAASDALSEELAALPGVVDASARVVASDDDGMRVLADLHCGPAADLADVQRRCEDDVLAHFAAVLGMERVTADVVVRLAEAGSRVE